MSLDEAYVRAAGRIHDEANEPDEVQVAGDATIFLSPEASAYRHGLKRAEEILHQEYDRAKGAGTTA